MSEPLTAPNRMELSYVVGGFVHKLRMYFQLTTYLGGNYVTDREATIPTVLWGDAAQYVWNKLRPLMTGPVAAPVVKRQTRDGLLWLDDEFLTLTGAGSGAGAYLPAQQLTWVVRDTAAKKIRFVIMESSIAAYLGHSQDGLTNGAEVLAVSQALSGADANGAAPFRWMKSRNNRFIAASGAIAGFTIDVNDKLKRDRGLE